jgi:hypothetical protein
MHRVVDVLNVVSGVGNGDQQSNEASTEQQHGGQH